MATLNINGQSKSVDAAGDSPLLWAIREQLQMTGTKFGCGAGLCGACTVHVNGEAVRFALQLRGNPIWNRSRRITFRIAMLCVAATTSA